MYRGKCQSSEKKKISQYGYIHSTMRQLSVCMDYGLCEWTVNHETQMNSLFIFFMSHCHVANELSQIAWFLFLFIVESNSFLFDSKKYKYLICPFFVYKTLHFELCKGTFNCIFIKSNTTVYGMLCVRFWMSRTVFFWFFNFIFNICTYMSKISLGPIYKLSISIFQII